MSIMESYFLPERTGDQRLFNPRVSLQHVRLKHAEHSDLCSTSEKWLHQTLGKNKQQKDLLALNKNSADLLYLGITCKCSDGVFFLTLRLVIKWVLISAWSMLSFADNVFVVTPGKLPVRSSYSFKISSWDTNKCLLAARLQPNTDRLCGGVFWFRHVPINKINTPICNLFIWNAACEDIG